jgi:hypothetical protein
VSDVSGCVDYGVIAERPTGLALQACGSARRPSVIRDERIRSGLPAACDQCGAPAVRLVAILYERTGETGLVGDVYYGGCVVVSGAPTWICRARGHWGV